MIMNDKLKITIIFVFLIFVLIFSICIGSSDITPLTVYKVIANNLFNSNYSVTNSEQSIIWFIRLPRILVGTFAGFSLAVCGLIMQSLTRNQIATPYTLGVSTGASLGVAIPIFFGITLPIFPNFTFSFFGFLGALFSISLVLLLVNKFDETLSNTSIIIIGMVMSMTLSGILTILTALFKDKAQIFIFWQMGSLASKEYIDVFVLGIISIVCILFSYSKHIELDILSMSETQAKLVGVETNKVKIKLIIIMTILTGAVVSTCGVIGFIGLVSAHISRKLFKNNHKILIITSGIIGSIMLVISDTISRTILSPIELPVGAITTLIGGPFFAYVYLGKKGGVKC